VPELNVAQNLFLGQELQSAGFIDWSRLYRKAEEVLKSLGESMRVNALARELSVAQKQLVEIARTILAEAKVVAFDEPTSGLSFKETEKLFRLIQSLKGQGIGIIYVSHRLKEIFEIADRVTVLKDGLKVGTFSIGELDNKRLVQLMVGREVIKERMRDFSAEKHFPAPVLLKVSNLTRDQVFQEVSFEVKAGEILCIAGLAGSGRSEVLRSIFGLEPLDDGEIFVCERRVNVRTPRDAMSYGLGFLPEDRKLQALVLGMSIESNMTLPMLKQFVNRWGFLQKDKRLSLVNQMIKKLSIRPPDPTREVGTLSGGNQQKVALARWLCAKSKILLLDEPTRGVDVGAREEIYSVMNDFVKNGGAIVAVSSDLPEVLHIADRVLVMRAGKIAGEIDGKTASEEKIMRLATGV
jgi:ABC-type sugar transport system ATPase subunit